MRAPARAIRTSTISDDGRRIYVALDGTKRIAVYDPMARELVETFRIGEAERRVEDLEVVPGRNDAVVVSLNPGPGGSRNKGIAAFVEGVALPKIAPGPTNAISYSDDPTVLFGHNSAFSPHTTMLTLSVDLSSDGGVERGQPIASRKTIRSIAT